MSPIDRRSFLKALSAGAVTASLPLGCGSGGASGSRPNIVILLADDMGFSDVGCYGGEINTPNIDALAANGLRFTQFYNTARCCPTRASLLTGLYAHQAGVGHMMNDYGLPGYRGRLNRECVTMAEALKPAGYTTLMSGKWHVTPINDSTDNWPLQRGFDRFFGTIHGAGSFYDPATLARGNELIEPQDPNFYYTYAIADNAIGFIAEAPRDRPFFLYVPFTAPHWPLHAYEQDSDKYRNRYDAGWDALREERHQRMIEMGIVDERWPLTPRDEYVPAWEDAESKEWQARRMEVYAAQIEALDHAIGRIMDSLGRAELTENTLVLFLADNGGCAEELSTNSQARHIPAESPDGRPVRVGNDPAIMPGPSDTYQSYGRPWANASNTPFRLYKHWVHEGGISTPLIAHWPAHITQAGGLTDQPGHLIDLMATCLDVAGAQYPESFGGNEIIPLEGKSLVPVFETGERDGHDAIFWEHEGNRAVRQGNWKLVSRYRPETGGEWELYDLEADRTEINNLVDQEPDKAAELIRLYEQWAERSRVVPWRSWQQPQAASG